MNILDDEIVSIEYAGVEDVYDISMIEDPHNFAANGIVVHNCGAHAIAYSLVGYYTAYYKTNFPHQFLIANIKHARSSGKMTETEYVSELIKEAREMGIKVELPTFDNVKIEPFYSKNDGVIYLGLNTLKGIGDTAADILVNTANTTSSFKEFAEKSLNTKVETGRYKKDGSPILRPLVNKSHISTLVRIGFFGDIEQVVHQYKEVVGEDIELKSSSEMVNEALGFDYHSPFDSYKAALPANLLDTDKYLIVKVTDLKSGEKNGRKWNMLKGDTEIGQITAFMNSVAGIDKGDVILIEYSRGKSDAINVRSYRLL